MALADKKQYNQVLNLLNELLFSDVPNIVSHNFLTADTVDHLEKAFKNTSEENSKNFEKINKELVAHNFVRKEVKIYLS